MDAESLIKARNDIESELEQLSRKIKELQEVKNDYECELWDKCEHIWVRQDDCGRVGWNPRICSKCQLLDLQPSKNRKYLR